MNKALGYIGEVRIELSKVTWPKRQEVIKLTTTVILISVIVGAYVGGLDYIFTKLLELAVLK